MKRPEVITLRPRPVVVVQDVAEPVADVAPPRVGWVGLRGQVYGEFRACGGRPWRDDPMVSARTARRVTP